MSREITVGSSVSVCVSQTQPCSARCSGPIDPALFAFNSLESLEESRTSDRSSAGAPSRARNNSYSRISSAAVSASRTPVECRAAWRFLEEISTLACFFTACRTPPPSRTMPTPACGGVAAPASTGVLRSRQRIHSARPASLQTERVQCESICIRAPPAGPCDLPPSPQAGPAPPADRRRPVPHLVRCSPQLSELSERRTSTSADNQRWPTDDISSRPMTPSNRSRPVPSVAVRPLCGPPIHCSCSSCCRRLAPSPKTASVPTGTRNWAGRDVKTV